MLYVFYLEPDYLLQTFATALLNNSVATAEVICRVFLCSRSSEAGAVLWLDQNALFFHVHMSKNSLLDLQVK